MDTSVTIIRFDDDYFLEFFFKLSKKIAVITYEW